jgi:hypothetical protein
MEAGSSSRSYDGSVKDNAVERSFEMNIQMCITQELVAVAGPTDFRVPLAEDLIATIRDAGKSIYEDVEKIILCLRLRAELKKLHRVGAWFDMQVDRDFCNTMTALRTAAAQCSRRRLELRARKHWFEQTVYIGSEKVRMIEFLRRSRK